MEADTKKEFLPHEIQWDRQRTVALWDFYAKSVAHRKRYFGKQSGAEIAKLLKAKVLCDVREVLDFSCGRGDLIAALIEVLRKDQTIHGSDVSVDSASETIARNQHSEKFTGTTVLESLPSALSPEKFDLVIATEIVEHLNDDELDAILKEIVRVTKPGGFVFVTTPFEENLDANKTMCPDCACVFHVWQHQRSWTLTDLRTAFEKVGFETMEIKNIQWGPLLLKWYFWLARIPGNGIYYIGKKPI